MTGVTYLSLPAVRGADNNKSGLEKKCLFPCKLCKISLHQGRFPSSVGWFPLCISMYFYIFSLPITQFCGKELPILPVFSKPSWHKPDRQGLTPDPWLYKVLFHLCVCSVVPSDCLGDSSPTAPSIRGRSRTAPVSSKTQTLWSALHKIWGFYCIKFVGCFDNLHTSLWVQILGSSEAVWAAVTAQISWSFSHM